MAEWWPKKMYNRLGCNQLATERDAYDFAVARTAAPDDLAYAWGLMSTEMKTSTLDLCRQHGQGDTSNHMAMRELAETRYDDVATTFGSTLCGCWRAIWSTFLR